MTRDQKLIEAVQLGIDVLTGYLLLRRVVTRYVLMRSPPLGLLPPPSTMG